MSAGFSDSPRQQSGSFSHFTSEVSKKSRSNHVSFICFLNRDRKLSQFFRIVSWSTVSCRRQKGRGDEHVLIDDCFPASCPSMEQVNWPRYECCSFWDPDSTRRTSDTVVKCTATLNVAMVMRQSLMARSSMVSAVFVRPQRIHVATKVRQFNERS